MTEIFVKLSAPGFHHWENATTERDYLGATHRHLFLIEVCMPVTNQDREVEFHDLMDEVKALFPHNKNHGGMSCEMMASDIGEKLASKYNRRITVEVSEDGEAGARVIIEGARNA
tara:strand:- start:3970 stop:4314 length:345 start_codon:yes stop_codon:yes gene_type:complete